jgi:anaerobic ribonucleoside-triphosphate reductase activating protein
MIDAYVSRVSYPVTSLGYGRRVGVWFQGCTIRCPGCIVPETWERTSDHLVPLPALLQAISSWLPEADGLTISGGEPFEQPEALKIIVEAARDKLAGDILVYSGYSAERLHRDHADLLARVDALVSGPFQAGQPDARSFIGSSNQRLVSFTELAKRRYSDLTAFERSMDVSIGQGFVYLAGVPLRGGLTRLAEGMKTRGMEVSLTHEPV